MVWEKLGSLSDEARAGALAAKSKEQSWLEMSEITQELTALHGVNSYVYSFFAWKEGRSHCVAIAVREWKIFGFLPRALKEV